MPTRKLGASYRQNGASEDLRSREGFYTGRRANDGVEGRCEGHE